MNETISLKDGEIDAYNKRVNELEQELESLKNYKNEREENDKRNLLNEYKDLLEDSEVQAYEEKLGDYSYNSLKSELAVKILDSNKDLFTRKIEGYIPNGDNNDALCDAEKIVKKYTNKDNGGKE